MNWVWRTSVIVVVVLEQLSRVAERQVAACAPQNYSRLQFWSRLSTLTYD